MMSVASVTIAVNIGISMTVGVGMSVIGSGLFNLSQNRPFFENVGTSVIFGAAAGLIIPLFPWLGVGLAGVGLGFSINNFREILIDQNTTTSQRIAAFSLVLYSAGCAYLAASYGAGASQKGNFWYNLSAFSSSPLIAYKGAIEKLYNMAQSMKSVNQHSGKTNAVALVRDPKTDTIMHVAMSNEGKGAVRPEIRTVLPADTQYATYDPANIPSQYCTGKNGNPHAEVRITFWAESQGYEVLAIGSSRNICPDCAVFMGERGIGAVSPLRDPIILDVLPTLEHNGFQP
jgi:hypothetical protein